MSGVSSTKNALVFALAVAGLGGAYQDAEAHGNNRYDSPRQHFNHRAPPRAPRLNIVDPYTLQRDGYPGRYYVAPPPHRYRPYLNGRPRICIDLPIGNGGFVRACE